MKLTKTAAAFLLSALLILTMMPAAAWAEASESAPGGKAASAGELNQALGGQHEVTGNKVTLRENVILGRDILVKAAAPLTLDLNGKTITWDEDAFFTNRTSTDETREEPISSGIFVESDMTFTGNGTIRIERAQTSVIMPYACDVTFQGGTYEAKGEDAAAIDLYGLKKETVKLRINGGTFLGGVYSIEGAAANIEVNGGTLSSMNIKSPHIWYSGRIQPTYSGKNRLRVNGGKIGELYCEAAATAIRNGAVTRGMNVKDCSLFLYGGKISGTGLDVFGKGKFVMKGGTIRAADGEGLDLSGYASKKKKERQQATLSGGTILTEKKNAKGIAADGNVAIKLNGTKIKSVKRNGKTGISLNGKHYAVNLTLQGVKKKSTYIKGFKNGIYQIGKKGTVRVGKRTKVYAPKAKKKSYIAGKKLPKKVRGNLSIKYRK